MNPESRPADFPPSSPPSPQRAASARGLRVVEGLRLAAAAARDEARRWGTPVWVLRDGKVVGLTPEEAARAADAAPPSPPLRS